MLEDANIKLASVATDVLGASGRTTLQAIAAGEDDQRLRTPNLSQSLVRRWQSLGFQVTLTPASQPS
jgi:hypothetical protein